MERRIIPGIFSVLFHFILIILILTIPSPEVKIKTPQTILAYLPKTFPVDAPLIYPSPKKEDEQNKREEKIEEKKDEEKSEVKKDDRIFVRRGDVEAPMENKQLEKSIPIEPQKPAGESKGEGTGKGSDVGKTQKNEIDSGLKLKNEERDGQKKGGLRFPSTFSFEGGPPKGGGGYPYQGFGASAYFDSGGYDITPWAREVIKKVKSNWFIPTAARYGIRGVSTIYLVFERDGSISEFTIYKPSGVISFDQSALNALTSSVPFPPLPYDLPKKNLPAYVVFYYNIYPEEK